MIRARADARTLRRRLAAAAVLAVAGCAGRADPDALWKQAEADFQAGRHEQAAAAVGQLAKLRSPTPLDRLLRAQVALFRKRDDEALAELAGVPDADPLAAQARLLAGQVELRRHRLRAAEALLRRAADLDPDLAQARRELIYIYGVLLRRKELAAEFAALSKLAKLTYDNVFHWCLTRGAVWDPREQVAELKVDLEADPGDRWTRLALAENLRRTGARGEAESVLGALPKDDPEALLVRVDLALDRGDDRAAEALLAAGPEGDAGLERLRGKFALARRDGPAAVRHYRAAYRADPDDRNAVLGLARALGLAGEKSEAEPFQAAARDFEALGGLLQRAANDQGRSDPALLRALGAACEKVHRLPEALAWYRLAIEADPLDKDAQRALFRLDAGGSKPGP